MVLAISQHIGQSNRDRRTNLRNGRKVYKIQENSIVQPGTNLNLNHRLPTPQMMVEEVSRRLRFFSVVHFSHRRSARIKKLIYRKLTGAPQNLGVDPYPVPVGHFGAPWRPFWIFEVLIEGMIESKKLFSES